MFSLIESYLDTFNWLFFPFIKGGWSLIALEWHSFDHLIVLRWGKLVVILSLLSCHC